MLQMISKLRFLTSCNLNHIKAQRHIHVLSTLNSITKFPKGTYEFPESQADIEISTAEWKFVERLLPLKHIPTPNFKPGTTAPSGWIAPSASRQDYPYFVTRNKNHLFKIYKETDLIMRRVRTRLGGIEGDIFALGEELKPYLLEVSQKRLIVMRINEPHGTILVKSDLVQPITDFLHQKGF